MMNIQPARGGGRSVVVMFLAVALGLVGPLLYLYFSGPTGKFESQTALVFGALSIVLGVAIVIFSMGRMPNSNMKTAVTLCGVMGIASGLGMIAGGAGYNWFLFVGIAIAGVCWILAKRQLKKPETSPASNIDR
jgi:peptidoglycan/LPS O-acetylase OafA/YrhL